MTDPKKPTRKIVIPRKAGEKTYWDDLGGVWEKEDGKRADYGKFRLIPPDWDGTFRDCLVNQSAGEHEGFLVQRRTIFEARSSATGRKNGRRWGKKARAQPGMILPNSLSISWTTRATEKTQKQNRKTLRLGSRSRGRRQLISGSFQGLFHFDDDRRGSRVQSFRKLEECPHRGPSSSYLGYREHLP